MDVVDTASVSRLVETAEHGQVEVWHQVLGVGGGCVRFKGYGRFATSGEVLVSTSELRFRSEARLVESLTGTCAVPILRVDV